MKALVSTFAAIGLAVSVPTHAQSPMGFRLGQDQRDHRTAGPDTPPQETLMRSAKCVAEDRPEEVRAYLASTPGSTEEAALYEVFGEKLRKCMPNVDFSAVGNMQGARGSLSMSFEHSTLRGALAESLLREDKTELLLDRIMLGDDGMFVAERFHGERSGNIERVFALGFAGCVMGHNAETLDALFQTDPGSDDEKQAIMAMSESFGQCVMEGQNLKLRAWALRNQLAEVVYYAVNMEAQPDA